MVKPDGLPNSLTASSILYGIGENWTKGSHVPFKIKATVPAFLRQSGEKMRGGLLEGQGGVLRVMEEGII